MSPRLTVISVLAGLIVAGAFTAGISLSGATRAKAAAQPIAYVPIDPRAIVSHQTAQGWASSHNESAIQNHVAVLWSALTALTNQKLNGTPLAVFETWYTPCDIYPGRKECDSEIIRNPTDFEVPLQFFHTPRISANNIFSSVKYDAEMKTFVDEGFRGSPYTDGSGLVKAINAGQKEVVDTAVPAAIAVKPVYELLSQTRPTVITYWQGPGLNVPLGASSSPLVPGWDTWLKVVVVDPTGRETNAKPVPFCANTIDPTGYVVAHRYYVAPAGTYRVIPLKEFYYFPVTGADQIHLARIRADFAAHQAERIVHKYGARGLKQDLGCPSVDPVNPVAAFVAMHVTTAELNDTWTWQTFWWQPDVRGLPGARGPFRHFATANAYWTIDKPPYGYRYAFNPYLEGPFGTSVFVTPSWTTSGAGSVPNLGRTTDCISCHSTATYTENAKASPSPGYVAHGTQPQIPTTNSILTRNLWSMAIRAGHPVTSP